MAVTIVATPGASNANSYITEAEADAYFAARVPLNPPWSVPDDTTAALAQAAKMLDALAVAHRTIRWVGDTQYYYTSRQWTGTVATGTQSMAWPREGMYDRLGRAIANTVIPQELKDAQAELAGQLLVSDTTLDNSTITGGITSVKAGSVAVTFKDMIARHVLPSYVYELMPASWFTDELLESAISAQFDIISQ